MKNSVEMLVLGKLIQDMKTLYSIIEKIPSEKKDSFFSFGRVGAGLIMVWI